MFTWFARAVLLRFLPRRLLPILTAIELFRIVRGLRRKKQPVNEPTASRTAPPPALPVTTAPPPALPRTTGER